MAIDFDKFLDWAEDRFHGDVVVSGNEIKINSIFAPDYKHHMWCNPYGGKTQRANGVFHCWKTENKGSLITLVMLVDKCDYEQAVNTLDAYDVSIVALEKKLEEFWENKQKSLPKEINPNQLSLPPFTALISELDESDAYRIQAETHLLARGIPMDGFYVCFAGDYKNRIVIPYYDKNHNLIYYNARLMGKNGLKYMGPPKEVGVGKSDVLYIPGKWITFGDIYLTEGEFDAKILEIVGFDSGAFGGKELNDNQLPFLKNLSPIIAVDNDSAGAGALIKIGDKLESNGFAPYYVRPPNGVKDWNEMYLKYGANILKSYINKNVKKYDKFELAIKGIK